MHLTSSLIVTAVVINTSQPNRGLGLGSRDPLPENFSGSILDATLLWVVT